MSFQVFNFPAQLRLIEENKLTDAPFSHRSLDDGSCELLAAALANNTSLTVLDLQTNNITSQGVISLCNALVLNTTLTEINMEHNKIDDDGAMAVLKVLEVNTTIHSFHVSMNEVSDALNEQVQFRTGLNTQPYGLKSLAPQLLVNDPSATKLIIGDAEKPQKVSLALLKKVLSNNDVVDTLDLQNCGLGDTGADIVGDIVESKTALAELDISFNGIGVHGLKSIAEHLSVNKSIKTLLMCSNKLGDDAARVLVEMLKDNDSLTAIDLADNAVSLIPMEAVNRSLSLNQQPLVVKRAQYAALANDPKLTTIDFRWEKNMKYAADFLAPSLKANAFVKTLLLSNARMGDDGAADMCTVIRTNKSIVELALANNNITNAGGAEIARALIVNSALTDVNLANNDMDAEVGPEFSAMLLANNTLSVLNMELNNLSDEQMSEIDGLLIVNQQPVQLKRILPEIESNSEQVVALNFSEFDGQRFYNDAATTVLCQALRLNTFVKTIDLSANNIGDAGAHNFASLLYTNSTLETIALSNNSIGDRGALSFANALLENTTLLELILDTNCVGESGAQAFLSMLQHNHFVNVISLEHNRIPRVVLNDVQIACAVNTQPQSLKFLLPRLRQKDETLTELDLSQYDGHRYYNDSAVKILCHEIRDNPHIASLNLAHNTFGVEGMQWIANLLVSEACQLKLLNLSHNDLGDDGAAVLAEALERNQTVEVVDVQRCSIGDTGATALARALHSNDTVKDIIVTEEDISAVTSSILGREIAVNHQEIALKRVLPALQDNDPSVTSVEFVGSAECAVAGDVSCRLLALALAENTHVTQLDLSCNDISTEGVEYLADMLEDNRTIVEVNLMNNRIDDTGVGLFIKMLSVNDGIRVLDLTGNPVSEPVANELEYVVRINNGPLALKKTMVGIAQNDPNVVILNFDGKESGSSTLFDDDAVHVLCSLLVENTCVREIYLGHNAISDTGAGFFGDVLLVNGHLERLHLNNNHIGADGGQALHQALKHNYTLTELKLEKNAIPKEILENINAALIINAQPLKEFRRNRGEFKKRPQASDVDNNEMFKDAEYMRDCGDQIFDDAMVESPIQEWRTFEATPVKAITN